MKLRLTCLPILMILLMLIPCAVLAKETKTVLFKFANAEPVTFNHDVHLEKYNNNCRICHNAIFNLKQRRHYTMAEMEKTKSCGACHTGVKAFSVADEKSCGRCHKGKPRAISFKVKGMGETSFSHELHLGKTGGKCKNCHDGKVITGKEKAVTMAQMGKGMTCGACHNGKSAFSVAGNCDRCHKGFKPATITFKTDAGEASFSHEIHLGMFKCADCHTGIFPFKAGAKHASMAEMETGKSCGTCHNGKEAFAVKGDCAKCHKM